MRVLHRPGAGDRVPARSDGDAAIEEVVGVYRGWHALRHADQWGAGILSDRIGLLQKR